jgi:hypothetical protein
MCSFEILEQFKYLETSLKNYISIQEEIKRRLKSGNACYYFVRRLLSSSLLSKHLKIKIYGNLILSVVSYGCETWSLLLNEVGMLGVFENRALRRIFGPMKGEITGELRKLHSEEHNNLFSLPNIFSDDKFEKNVMSGTCSSYGGV